MKILLLLSCFFVFSCTSTSKNDREPAQNYQYVGGKNKKILYFNAYVQVRDHELPPQELNDVKRTCRALMVTKLLHYRDKLVALDENLIALDHKDNRLGITDTLTAWTGGKYFEFVLVGPDDNKYRGYMYLDPNRDENYIESQNGNHVYHCIHGADGYYDFAQLKDQRGTLVFSSSFAVKSINNEGINERGRKVKLPK